MNTQKPAFRGAAFVSFALLLMLFLTVPAFSQSGGLRTVKADEFFRLYDERQAAGDAVLIDVRTPAEYADGHAPGSENIDFYAPDFRSSIERLDKDASYFLYCRSGSRSGQTLRMMRSMGFREVYDLSGGWSENSERLAGLEER